MLKVTSALVLICIGITTTGAVQAKGISPMSKDNSSEKVITTTKAVKPSASLPTIQQIEAAAKNAVAQSNKKANKLFATPMNTVKLGTTAYDLQTNGSIYRRIGSFVDGGTHYAQAVWIASGDTNYSTHWASPTIYPDRGSYYAVMDLTDMTKPTLLEPAGNAKWKRAENERAGFCNLIQLGTNGKAGIVAHPAGSNGLLFTTNSEFGVASFSSQSCGSSTANGLWARAAVDGKGYIHVIYSYQTTDSKSGTLGYIRSTNGGKNWSDELAINNLENLNVRCSGGDDYAIAARGNTVVIAYSGNASTWLRIYKSTDNGANFTGIDGAEGVMFTGPSRTSGKIYSTSIGGGKVSYHTDTVPTPGTSINVILDKDEKAHVIFGQYMCSLFGVGELVKGSNGQDSIANSGGDTVDVIAVKENPAYTSLGMAYWKEGEQNAVAMAPPCGGMWDGKGTVISARNGEGMSSRPILSYDEASGNLLCVYSSFVNGDMKSLPWDKDADTDPIVENDFVADTVWGDALFMNTYVTVRKSDGSWSTPQLLSQTGRDNRDATVYENTVDGFLYMMWQSDAAPGCWVGNPQIIQPSRVADVWFATVPLSGINAVDDETGVVREDGLTIASFPNPAGNNGATIQFGSERSGIASVEVFNALGSKVASLYNGVINPGTYNLPLETNELANGAYYVVVKVGANMASKTINVVR